MKNKVKKIILALILLNILISTSIAQERALLKVSGLVCSFCVQGIKKSFEKNSSVKSTEVDLDKHEVSLEFVHDKTLSDQEISEILKAAGYNLLEVTRTTASHDSKLETK